MDYQALFAFLLKLNLPYINLHFVEDTINIHATNNLLDGKSIIDFDIINDNNIIINEFCLDLLTFSQTSQIYGKDLYIYKDKKVMDFFEFLKFLLNLYEKFKN